MGSDGGAVGAERRSRWPLVLGLVVVVYAAGLAFLGGGEALDAVAAASLLPLFGAVGCQVAVVLLWPLVHRASLRAVGADLPYREVLPVSMSIFSVSRTVPMGGAVGAAVGVERFTRRGIPGPAATGAAFLTGPLALLTIVMLGAIGIALAVVAGELGPTYLAAAGGILVLILAIVAAIVAALHSPRVGERIIGWLARRHDRLEAKADGWRSSWRDVTEQPPSVGGVARIIGWSLTKWTFDMASLGLVFLAFGRTPELTVLLVGFGISQLAATVPTTPGSVGVAEGGMVGAFAVLGIPVGIGATVAIAYRVFETWLPTVAGIPVLLRTRAPGPSASGPTTSTS